MLPTKAFVILLLEFTRFIHQTVHNCWTREAKKNAGESTIFYDTTGNVLDSRDQEAEVKGIIGP